MILKLIARLLIIFFISCINNFKCMLLSKIIQDYMGIELFSFIVPVLSTVYILPTVEVVNQYTIFCLWSIVFIKIDTLELIKNHPNSNKIQKLTLKKLTLWIRSVLFFEFYGFHYIFFSFSVLAFSGKNLSIALH